MLFSFGDLITLVVVLLIVIVFRAIDRNNRSLEKLKRFSDKITENLSALVEGKTLEMRDLSVELQAELKAGKEMIVHTRTADEQLRGRTSEIESIHTRLTDYEKALTDLTAMSSRVDTNMKRLRDESAFVDVVGRKIGETATRLDKVQKLIPEMEKAFAAQGRQTLETARTEVISAMEAKVGTLAAAVADSDKKVKDFSSYIARLEAREEQTEKERIAGLSKALDAFDADLRGRLSAAAHRGETLEDEVFTRLSSRIQANENALAAGMGTIELRLADYQGDVDYRVKVLEDAHHDVEALRVSLLQTMDKMAVSMRTEMKGIAEKHAAELMAGWKSEVAGAETAQEKLHASMGQLTAELEELKSRAYQDAEKQLSVFEEEFFADLRARSTLTQQKFQAWQAEMEKRAESFEAAVRERAASFEAAVRERAAGFEAGVKDDAAALEAELAARASKVAADVSTRVESLAAEVEKRTAGIEADAGARVQRLAAEVEKRTAGIEADAGARVENLAAEVEKRAAGIEADAGARVQRLAAEVEKRAAGIE